MTTPNVPRCQRCGEDALSPKHAPNREPVFVGQWAHPYHAFVPAAAPDAAGEERGALWSRDVADGSTERKQRGFTTELWFNQFHYDDKCPHCHAYAEEGHKVDCTPPAKPLPEPRAVDRLHDMAVKHGKTGEEALRMLQGKPPLPDAPRPASEAKLKCGLSMSDCQMYHHSDDDGPYEHTWPDNRPKSEPSTDEALRRIAREHGDFAITHQLLEKLLHQACHLRDAEVAALREQVVLVENKRATAQRRAEQARERADRAEALAAKRGEALRKCEEWLAAFPHSSDGTVTSFMLETASDVLTEVRRALEEGLKP